MSYIEAVQDGIPIEKDSKGFNWYYPPCHICNTPVANWCYIRGAQYVCHECRHELIILKKQTKLDDDSDKKAKRLQIAIKRISSVTDIKQYKNAIDWVEKKSVSERLVSEYRGDNDSVGIDSPKSKGASSSKGVRLFCRFCAARIQSHS